MNRWSLCPYDRQVWAQSYSAPFERLPSRHEGLFEGTQALLWIAETAWIGSFGEHNNETLVVFPKVVGHELESKSFRGYSVLSQWKQVWLSDCWCYTQKVFLLTFSKWQSFWDLWTKFKWLLWRRVNWYLPSGAATGMYLTDLCHVIFERLRVAFSLLWFLRWLQSSPIFHGPTVKLAIPYSTFLFPSLRGEGRTHFPEISFCFNIHSTF